MKQTHYPVKISTHDKNTEIFTELFRDCRICQKKEIQGLLRTITENKLFFQGFQGLEKAVVNFKYVQALQGPVGTLPYPPGIEPRRLIS